MDNMTIVSVLDRALDRTAMDVRKYGEKRDESLIRELPGQRATRFVLRPLTVSQFSALVDARTGGRSTTCAIAYGLARVLMPSGDAIEPTHDSGQPGVLAWTDAALDVVFRRYGGTVMIEVASVIERLAYVGEGETTIEGKGEGGGVSFTLPPLSLRALEQIARPPAGQTPIA